MKTQKTSKIICKCGYEWITASTLAMVSCPSCLGKVSNPNQLKKEETKNELVK